MFLVAIPAATRASRGLMPWLTGLGSSGDGAARFRDFLRTGCLPLMNPSSRHVIRPEMASTAPAGGVVFSDQAKVGTPILEGTVEPRPARGRCRDALLCGLGLSLGAGPAVAEVTTTWGSWAQVVAEGDLGFVDPSLQKLRLWLEGQLRWNQDWQHFYQGLARAALGYSFSDRTTVWLGYTFVPTQLQGKPYVGQQELWTGFRYIMPTEFGTFMFRTMFEADFIRGDDPRYRPRQLIRYLRPFEFEQRLSLIVWDEFFVRLNSTPSGGSAGFDQNRAFVGLGWSFTPGVRAELGYMNQYVEDATQTNEVDNNLIMGSLFVNW